MTDNPEAFAVDPVDQFATRMPSSGKWPTTFKTSRDEALEDWAGALGPHADNMSKMMVRQAKRPEGKFEELVT